MIINYLKSNLWVGFAYWVLPFWVSVPSGLGFSWGCVPSSPACVAVASSSPMQQGNSVRATQSLSSCHYFQVTWHSTLFSVPHKEIRMVKDANVPRCGHLPGSRLPRLKLKSYMLSHIPPVKVWHQFKHCTTSDITCLLVSTMQLLVQLLL